MQEWRKLSWWRDRVIELTVGCMAAFLIVQTISYREAQERLKVPPEAWFEVHDIYVPDHEIGSNPLMVYDRSIYVDHRGFWIAEVQRRNRTADDMFFNACSGSGVDQYETTDVIPDDTVSWEWFFGRPCVVGPGTYRIQLTREMTRPEWPPKRSVAYSNTFTVYPAGEAP